MLRHVIRHLQTAVCASKPEMWYYLGMELLHHDAELNAMRKESGSTPDRMFVDTIDLWLRSDPEATWRQILDALKQEHIALNSLANTVEKLLLPTDDHHAKSVDGEQKECQLGQSQEQNTDNQCSQLVTARSCTAIGMQSVIPTLNRHHSNSAMNKLSGRCKCT